MKKVRQTFSKEIKLKAIKLYTEEGMGYKSIAKELGIKCHKIVQRWVKHYQNEGVSGLDEKREKSSVRKKGPRKHPLTLEEENERLRAENEYLKSGSDWKGSEDSKETNKSLYAHTRVTEEIFCVPAVLYCRSFAKRLLQVGNTTGESISKNDRK